MTEQELIQSMTDMLSRKMAKDYEKGKTKRDAHPKTLGVMKASFKIANNIPENLRVGVFEEAGKEYKAFLRFSNAKGKVVSDKKKDFRGIAIKLLDVEGDRFSNDEKHTQDFLLMTHPTMLLGTVKLFHDAVYYATQKNPLRLALHFIFTGHADIIKALAKGKANETSPLDVNYWSTTPYRLGNTTVKYKIMPTSSYKSTLPKPLTDNYLTENMKTHLAKQEASFDFYVQTFKNEEYTPIEDAAVEWTEENSPLVKVATLNIPMQDFDIPRMKELGEELSFSPANSLIVHEPVGGINRARNEIYISLSKFRHERDNRLMFEPSLVDFEAI